MSQPNSKYSSPARAEEAVNRVDTTPTLSTISTICFSTNSSPFSTQQRAITETMQISPATDSSQRKRKHRSSPCQDSYDVSGEDEVYLYKGTNSSDVMRTRATNAIKRDDDEEDSTDGGELDKRQRHANTGSSPSLDEDRRAHHNELERRRRDHIKDHFMALKNSIPLLEGERSSRALILKRAVDYISILQTQMREYKIQTEELRRQNDLLAAAASVQTHSFNRPTPRQPTQSMFMQSSAVVNPHQGPALSPVMIPSLHSPAVKPSPTSNQHVALVDQLSPIATTTNNNAAQDGINGLLSSLLLSNAAYFKNGSQVPSSPPLPSSNLTAVWPAPTINRTERAGFDQPLYSLAPSISTIPVSTHGQGTATSGDMTLQTSLLLNSFLLRERRMVTEQMGARNEATIPSSGLLSPKPIVTVVSG